MQRGEYQSALDVAKRAFAVLALTDLHAEVANLQLTMGGCHQRLGRLDKAEEFYLDALSTYRRMSDVLQPAHAEVHFKIYSSFGISVIRSNSTVSRPSVIRVY